MEYKLLFFVFSLIYGFVVLIRAKQNKEIIGNGLIVFPYLIIALSIVLIPIVIYNDT